MRMESPGSDFETFCTAEWGRLVRAMRVVCGDRERAEDVAQEAMIRVAERWRTVRDLESPTGWLHRVALNLALSQLRRRKAEERAYSRVDPVPRVGERDPSATVALRQALERLDHRAKAAIVLRYVADLSAEDTGAALGMTGGAVRTLTHRVLGVLRSELLHEDDIPSDQTEACA